MNADEFPIMGRLDRFSRVTLAREADFNLGPLFVRPSLCEITTEVRTEKIEPRVMEVLVALARARGASVSRAELIESCWSGRSVSDDAVERCIGRLRKLADTAGNAFTIETLPRIGYRLLHADERSAPAWVANTQTLLRWGIIGGLSLAAIVSGVVFSLLARPKEWAIVESKPLIATLLVERWPSLSPDGKTIAYSAGTSIFTRKIYLKRIEGGASVRVSGDDYDDTSPAWSTDGKRIVYVAFKAGEPCRIMEISTGGNGARQVGRCAVLERTFVVFAPTGNAVFLGDKAGPGAPEQIMRLDLASGKRSALSRPAPGLSGDSSPTMSPDKKSIAYLRYSDQGYAITVQNLRNGATRTIRSDRSWSDGLAWCEDSQSLFIATNRGGDHAIWLVPLDGSPLKRLTSSSLYLGRLSAGLGGQLAAEASADVQNLAETRDSGPALVYPAHGQTWSPTRATDGTLAMLSNRSGDNGVWIAKESGPIEIASFGSQFIYHLRWSPDGAQLAFEIREGDGSLHVRIISRAGAGIVALPAPGAQLDAPAWSGDGNTLVIAAKDSGGWRIWRAELNGLRRFEPASDYGWRGAQFHDGALYAVRDNAPGLWRLDKGRPARLVIADFKSDLPWAFTGDGIVFVDAPDMQHPRFLKKTLDAVPATVVASAEGYYADMTGEYGGGFAVNPKSGRITFVSGGRADTDIILMRVALQTF